MGHQKLPAARQEEERPSTCDCEQKKRGYLSRPQSYNGQIFGLSVINHGYQNQECKPLECHHNRFEEEKLKDIK